MRPRSENPKTRSGVLDRNRNHRRKVILCVRHAQVQFVPHLRYRFKNSSLQTRLATKFRRPHKFPHSPVKRCRMKDVIAVGFANVDQAA
jgi:hypothetical protein